MVSLPTLVSLSEPCQCGDVGESRKSDTCWTPAVALVPLATFTNVTVLDLDLPDGVPDLET
jgi:hypothetical protein